MNRDDFKDNVEKHFLEVIETEAKYCSDGIDTKGYLMTEIDYRTGIQVLLPRWFQKPSFFELGSIEDYDAVLSRLKMIPKRYCSSNKGYFCSRKRLSIF